MGPTHLSRTLATEFSAGSDKVESFKSRTYAIVKKSVILSYYDNDQRFRTQASVIFGLLSVFVGEFP